MASVRLKSQWSTLWLLAAAGVCALEIYAASGRGFSGPSVNANGDLQSTDEVAIANPVNPSIPIGVIGGSARDTSSAIVVLGNLNADFDGEVEVTLTAKPISTKTISSTSIPSAVSAGNGRPSKNPRSNRNRVELPESAKGVVDGSIPKSTPFEDSGRATHLPSQCEQDIGSGSNLYDSIDQPQRPAIRDSKRVYFLQTAIGSLGNNSGDAAIPCRLIAENRRIRIYVDERLPGDESLTKLVNAIDEASLSKLADVVHELVGPVCDIDQDGYLAVVLTPEVARLGRGQTPVDGLTRPADFLVGLDRPQGNNSDVIFLSSRLKPGGQLRAVLAHEWCHAAVFGRRCHRTDISIEHLAEDDWLNEAIAHIVEVRASGSRSNLSHRINSYLTHPGDSPLVVRDYCRPKFWRHDGCRGAAYLFLQWCLEQTDDSLLDRLVDGRSPGLDNLEAATGHSFAERFLGWTTSLGQTLANGADHLTPSSKDGVGAASVGLGHQRWQLQKSCEHTLTLRIRGTCAEFVHVECGEGNTTWQLSVTTASQIDQLQATLIPVISFPRVPHR